MEATIEQFGYLAVLIGTFMEGETVLILAGFAAHRGYLNLTWVIAAAFAGTLIGDQLFYFIGRRHSDRLLRWFPSWQGRVEKAQQMIDRHHNLILLGFRFLYGFRTVTPFTFGIVNVPARIFVPLNFLGALIWSVVIALAGYFFGHAIETVFGHLKQFELWIMLGIALLGGIVWLVRLRRSRRNNP